ncbi:MAG TPA: LD-carboxypeptidase, partial [Caulobacteraceae bacterium]|nr:LD-carboxypeptidase [Caulobacteraceae bacterium]
ERVPALARTIYGDTGPEIVFHTGAYASAGHFAGDDAARARAFLEVANDDSFDVLWFARGGYGSNRIAEQVLAGLAPAARAKTYLGYSDAGALLAGLYRAGFPHVAHGPVAQDILRQGGAAAIARALAWLVDRAPETLEPSLGDGLKAAAFNLTVFSQLLGTPLEPDLTDHVLMLEEVSEAMYRIDRSFFHVTSNRSVRRVAGIRLGRCSLITPNEPDFGMSEVEVARYWCERSGIPWLGRADIGHDVDNRIVPFGPGDK